MLFNLTVDWLRLLLVETVADFLGAEILADRVTVELRELLVGVLRTALVFDLTEEPFVLLLCTASCLTEGVAPILAGVVELVLADRIVVVPLEGFIAELRVVPDFCLTSEFVLFRLFLTIADFLSTLFLCVTAVLFLFDTEDLTAERVPTLF